MDPTNAGVECGCMTSEKKQSLSTNISFHLGNDTRQGQLLVSLVKTKGYRHCDQQLAVSFSPTFA